MSLFKVGRLCMKLAGRDAGQKCVVVETLDDAYVIIDGSTRRRKVNIKHLEPLNQILSLKNKASHTEVETIFKELNLPVFNTKKKESKERPRTQKIKKEAPVKEKAVKEKKGPKQGKNSSKEEAIVEENN
ncbi:MAG TPA: hypothetical protein VJI98_04710 [Candidatus Nanoarchaeia archaeon]|nr:hypothetical protein [Candidatus Nanoarchaeia archaeon]